MSDWIKIDPESFSSSERTKDSNGVEVIVGLSPFDIPEKIRGQYDCDLNRFVVEFSYLGESERRVPNVVDEHLTVSVGENSHRLYAVLIDTDSLGAQSVQLSLITEAFDRIEGGSEERQKKIFGIAKQIVETKGQELVPTH